MLAYHSEVTIATGQYSCHPSLLHSQRSTSEHFDPIYSVPTIPSFANIAFAETGADLPEDSEDSRGSSSTARALCSSMLCCNEKCLKVQFSCLLTVRRCRFDDGYMLLRQSRYLRAHYQACLDVIQVVAIDSVVFEIDTIVSSRE